MIVNQIQFPPPEIHGPVNNINHIHVAPYLDYIKQHEDGTVLVGGSDMAGQYWDGHATIFPNITEARLINNPYSSLGVQCGTSDGCFVGTSRKTLICDDVGSISLWTSNSGPAWSSWCAQRSAPEHGGTVLKIECLRPYVEYVTVGSDGHAKVWDVNLLTCQRSYPAHGLPVNGLSVKPYSLNTFATGSSDQSAFLWDENIEEPVMQIVQHTSGVETLKFLDENRILFGDENGAVNLIDIRNVNYVEKVMQFPASVHDMEFNANHKRIAVCCENNVVSMFDITDGLQFYKIYEDGHFNVVRGYAWDVDTPYAVHSVGWSSTVRTHYLAP